MNFDTDFQPLFFDVDQVPVEAVIGSGDAARRVVVSGKKALVHRATGNVLGVVSRDYRVVTNAEAVGLAREVCERAFPGLSPLEWEVRRASAPRTMSFAFIDLTHRAHVVNYAGSGSRRDDPYTPFLRVTNSFNGARALRFDIGFMRLHCSNGAIFEKEVATIRASHSREALQKLNVEVTAPDLSAMWEEFSSFLTTVRGIAMTWPQSMVALQAVLRTPEARSDDLPARTAALHALAADFDNRLANYRRELGDNAYAVFNTLTDIAARPPDNGCFHKDRHSIETRAGRWLKALARHGVTPSFDLDRWLPAWDVDTIRQSLPGRN